MLTPIRTCSDYFENRKKLTFSTDNNNNKLGLSQGGKFTGNLGTRFPQNIQAQANFLVGFTCCHELLSLTEGCELIISYFL